MDCHMKTSTWDFDVLPGGGSDATRRTHGSDQWALQDDGVLFPGFGTTQKGHFPTSSSSGTTTGSLDSASSGFAGNNRSNPQLLGACAGKYPGKVRNGWLFSDKEVDVTSSDKGVLPRVASGLEQQQQSRDKQQYQDLRMIDRSATARYNGTNGRASPENVPPKVGTAKESQLKRTGAREEAADQQGRQSRGMGLVSQSSPAKKHRVVAPGVQVPRCQVDGCRADLIGAKDYHRRHKVCEIHSKAPKVITSGIEQRFCQQCSRFHVLSEFDDAKRSCRRRLAGHNERRRKSSQDTAALSVASMLQADDRLHLNALLGQSYFQQHPLAMPLSLYENGNTRRGWSRFDLEEQVALAYRAQLINGDSRHHSPLPYAAAERLLMLLQANKGTAAVPAVKYMQGPASMGEGLTLSSSSQGPNMLAGLETALAAAPLGSSHQGFLDSGRALSLLSSQALPSRSDHATLEKLMVESAPRSPPPIHNQEAYHQHPPENPMKNTFSMADFTPNNDKLLALPSPRSLALSIGMAAGVMPEKEQRQDQKPLISGMNVVDTLGDNPMLAQLLQRSDLRCFLGGSSSQPSIELPNLHHQQQQPASGANSQHHYQQQQSAGTEPLQSGSINFSQELESLRGYDTSSLFAAQPQI